MQVRVAEFRHASFISKILFQLCYPHFLKGGDETKSLLVNNNNNSKEQGGSGCDVLGGEIRGNIKIQSHLVLCY